ncbi:MULTISPECIES: zf-HC2 domain-containing protein [unclassified Streptomyces]|uniref:zf-HC2 domain-containing protein n=1 Tax=unclassified Streptomyces TaxID=2593676 RepID=UPI002DDB50CA|nr:zf-HC2 domain-containing protein [Streptomyces sp. NBC_01795]WSA91848.1 zf-HC2 domain-containing protein [Streptomyces sp. NBC_01795]WSS44350.1 zf-HC2 domain-containing protein [Streptomyces sp. NBC_01187]
MSGEHAPDRLLARYARGDTGVAADELWALEAHLERCAPCREKLATAVDTEAPEVRALLEGVRTGLGPLLDGPAPAPPSSRRRDRLRGWATPVMVPWLCTTVLVVLAATLLDVLSGPSEVPLVLLFAPVLPVFGVAAAWTRGLDPAWELTAATPRAGLPLVLRRTAAVLCAVIPPLLLAGWLTGTALAQWLLPCLAFTTASLALGGFIGVTRAAVGLVTAWAGVIVAPTLALGRLSFALGPDWPAVWGAVSALGAVVVVVRKSAFTRVGAHR